MKALLIGGAVTMLAAGTTPLFAQAAPPTPPGVAQGTTPVPPQPPHPPLPPLPPTPPMAPELRVRMMSDHAMTRDELIAHVREMFARLDANHDGYVTKDEMSAFDTKMQGMHEKMMAMHERMKTMRLNVDERMDGERPKIDRGAMFDRLDTNHDGVISRQEFMAGRPEIRDTRVIVMRDGDHMKMMPDMREMPKMRGEPGMHMRGMGMGGMGAHLFEMADTNHDGRVSLQEAEAAVLAHFDRGDLNHDGRITPEERQKVREVRIERRSS